VKTTCLSSVAANPTCITTDLIANTTPSVRGLRADPSCYHRYERTIRFLVMSWWLLKILMNQLVNPTRPVWQTQLPVE
jgi:hypothetical protein